MPKEFECAVTYLITTLIPKNEDDPEDDSTDSTLAEPPIEAYVKFDDDIVDTNESEIVDLDFTYIIGRPSVTNSPFEASIQQLADTPADMIEQLPDIIAINPPAPNTAGKGPTDIQTGTVTLLMPRGIFADDSGSGSGGGGGATTPSVRYKANISMYQPEADNYGTKEISDSGLVGASLVEHDTYAAVSFSPDPILSGITHDVETRVSAEPVGGPASGNTYTGLWSPVSDGRLTINYPYLNDLAGTSLNTASVINVSINYRVVIKESDVSLGALQEFIADRFENGDVTDPPATDKAGLWDQFSQYMEDNYGGTNEETGEYQKQEPTLKVKVPFRSTAPEPPREVRGFLQADGSVKFIWKRPNYVGTRQENSGLNGYYYDFNNNVFSTPLTAIGLNTEVVFSGSQLSPGNTHTFRVLAENIQELRSEFATVTIEVPPL